MISEKMLILVGGLGTRLRSVVSDVPKPMAPIEYKPFLWYKLMQLKQAGFRNFVFCAGYLAEIIQNYFGTGEQFGVNIEYSIEPEPLGTGGAVRYAERFIDKGFFMCNGDCYYNFDPNPILDIVSEKNAKYVMLLTEPEIKGDYGVVLIDKNKKITQFVEKPLEEISPLINAGVYYLDPDILNYIPAGEKVSIEKDVFPKMAENDEPFYSAEYSGYFIDIGIPKNYFQFCEDVKSHLIEFPDEE